MFAVIRSGGKQYKVTEGETLDIELVDFPAEGAKKITISDVLLVGNGDKFSVGNPLLSGATVGLELVEETKAKKVIAYKYRRREGYHRTDRSSAEAEPREDHGDHDLVDSIGEPLWRIKKVKAAYATDAIASASASA